MPLRKSFVITARIWRVYANIAGFLLLSCGLSALVVWAGNETGPVFVASDVRPIITRTTPGGTLVYVYDQDRKEPCPGEVSQTFAAIGKRAELVEQRRNVVYTQPKLYDDLEAKVHVPADLKPGRYHFTSGIYSRCPTFNRFDPIAAFDVDIIPPNNIAGP